MPLKATSVPLMAHAINQYVEKEEQFILAVKLGIKAADAGRLVSHKDVKKYWEAKRATRID